MEVIRWIPGGDFGELIKVCLSWHAVDGIRWNLRPWIRFEKLDLGRDRIFIYCVCADFVFFFFLKLFYFVCSFIELRVMSIY